MFITARLYYLESFFVISDFGGSISDLIEVSCFIFSIYQKTPVLLQQGSFACIVIFYFGNRTSEFRNPFITAKHPNFGTIPLFY